MVNIFSGLLRIIILLFIFGIVSLLFSFKTLAQTPPALSVTPSILRLDLAEDQPETTLSYTNTSNQTLTLSLSASDFSELEYGYQPDFLDEKNAANYQYALSSWVSFETTTLVIPPQSTETLKIFINPNALTPGGHYAAIQARIITPDAHDTVTIQGSLSTLLFVRTATGKEKEAGKITSFTPSQSWIFFPSNFIFRFHNTGDTDVIPYGVVEIKDMWGRNVARGILNEGSLISLPESVRRYDISIKKNGFALPGRYTAEFKGHFGKTDQQMATQLTFWSEGDIPMTMFGIITILLIVVLRGKLRSFLKHH